MSNIIKTRLAVVDDKVKHEMESKIGKFIGKNHHSNKMIEKINQLEQLNKNECKYEFQSRISLDMYNRSLKYLQDLNEPIVNIVRLDFNFNKKEQRSSILITNDDLCTAILIEKRKKVTEHVDMGDANTHFRVSLSQEKTLSTSLKDILGQMEARKPSVALIRIKITQYLIKNKLEYAVSKVYQISKSHNKFKQIVEKIATTKSFHAKNVVKEIVESIDMQPEYEFEIEIVDATGIDEDGANELAQSLLDQTIQVGTYLEQNEDVVVKKVKTINDI